MSSNIILDETIEHGTPEGYERGCRSNGGCPAGAGHGLTCTRAKRFAAGNYRYRTLRGRGMSPTEIAAELELESERVIPKPKKRTKPAASTPAPVVPELDDEHDEHAADSEAGSDVETLVPEDFGIDSTDPRNASNKTIRAWAIERGYDVAPRGRVKDAIREHYIETHTAAPAPSAAETPAPEDLRATPDDPDGTARAAAAESDTTEAEDLESVAGILTAATRLDTTKNTSNDRPEWATVIASDDVDGLLAELDRYHQRLEAATAESDQLTRALDLERAAHAATARGVALALEKWETAQDRIQQLQADNTALDSALARERLDFARISGKLQPLHNENRELREQLRAKRARRGLAAWFANDAA
ncbi:hypothetical protein [Microbacterium sp. G2-8]|uniref:Lsr2 family DNA-binding protein n=1 Tax=Microbacterium sp. G2-8 TaxID=2842454 RepID=UPI001C8ABE57|nr:hypothetical protein [Microbacterium sp. G2-8]